VACVFLIYPQKYPQRVDAGNCAQTYPQGAGVRQGERMLPGGKVGTWLSARLQLFHLERRGLALNSLNTVSETLYLALS